MYNSIPVHARPIAQNIVSNTLLKNLDKTRKPIRITTHPLPESRVVSKQTTVFTVFQFLEIAA
jgi:hypothetical protein